jgi:hypothetical protein
MASVLYVPTPEQEREQLRELVIALVLRADGETTLRMSDMIKVKPGLQLERIMSGSGSHIMLRVVDPNAPVEGGTYWVRVLGGEGEPSPWEPAQFDAGTFLLPGDSHRFQPNELEIGARIPEPPEPPKEGPFAWDPPDGYRKLTAGIRCRCMRLWRGRDGSHWCCRGNETASKTASRVDERA